jgi:hypothetical protein
LTKQGQLNVFSPSKVPSRSWAAIYRSLIALSVLPLGGCGYVAAFTAADTTPRYDASSGADTAIIENAGGQPFGPSCKISHDDRLYDEVVIDAGAVVMQVTCSQVTGVFGERTGQMERANLAFHAEAGQHYQIAVSEDFGFPHVAVTAAKDGSAVIHRSLLGSRSAHVAGAAHVTLVSRSGAGVIPCKFGRPWTDRRASSVRRPAGSFARVPYSHQLVAECSTYAYVTGEVEERYEAPVDFVPLSGRLYTVHMDENNPHFVFVTDVSSEVQTIAHVRAVRTQ